MKQYLIHCSSLSSVKGVTDTLDGWHSRTGIKPSTIAMRLNRYGWTIEMALTKKGHHLDLHKL